jgi:hypothetical protein
MLCFRRRAPLSTREETLARLRPQTHTKETGMFAPSTPTPEPAAPARDLGFFENLRQFLTPYSFILMKGSPEGVIGRYMEELEGDDGEYDFGPLSRHAPDALRRKSTGNLEWFDWGESGYMVHVPLTSVFAPVLDLPTNADRVLGPPYRLISQYLNTFSDGTQERGIHRLVDEVKRGGAFEMIGRIGDHYSKKVAEGRERAAAARAQQASAVEEAARAQEAVSAAQKPTNVPNAPVKDKEGKGE